MIPIVKGDPAPVDGSAPQSFPALRQLGLADADLAVLQRQGFVAAEGRKPTRYKLRYRRDGRQRIRYLGSQAEFVAQVRRELSQLQSPMRQARALRRSLRTASRALRKAKRSLLPVLAATGHAYHGLIIRRRRVAPPEMERRVLAELFFQQGG